MDFNSSNSISESVGEVCIANISPKERKKRLDFAIQQFVFSIGVLAILLYFDVNVWWRLLLFLFFAAATTSFFQWRDKT